MKRFFWLGFVLFLYVICTGCGDTFRPIIVPNPPIFPNPKAAHTVLAINDNGTAVHGTAMVIDVSGDTDMSIANVGYAPVHAVQQSANQVLVVNHAVDNAQADSISKLNFSGLSINNSTTISLPAGSAPTFVAVAPTDTTAYVTLPTYVPDPINFPNVVVPSVGVVSTQSNNMVATITVGMNPVALAVTPNKSKLYVANQGDGTISAFNTADRSARTITGSLTNPPIWLVARTDNQRVYALEQTTGTLASIDVTSTAGPDTLTEINTISVPGATTMVYDSNLNRLYIPGGPQMAIVDVSQSSPQLLATVAIPPFALLPVGSSAAATATAAAALPDGSRAYVASYAVLSSQFNISSVTGDGTTAIYAYNLTAGHDLTPGVTVTVTDTAAGFDGTFLVGAVVSGTAACPGTCFQAPNTTTLAATAVSGSGTGKNIFPQVSVVNVSSNTIKKTVSIPGFPDATDPSTPQYYAPVCAPPAPATPYRATFRFMMAAGGDSSRAYLSSCDGGNVNLIDTSNDTYIENLPAPVGNSRPPIPPNPLNPPQNPVFLFAGP